MLFLTTEMVAPEMTAALNTRYDTTKRALAEGPTSQPPAGGPKREGQAVYSGRAHG